MTKSVGIKRRKAPKAYRREKWLSMRSSIVKLRLGLEVIDCSQNNSQFSELKPFCFPCLDAFAASDVPIGLP